MGYNTFSRLTSATESNAKKKADKRRFESDLLSMQSDYAHMVRLMESVELELRVLQKKYTQTGFDIKDKQEELQKSKSKMIFLNEEIRIIKKKISNL
jgi:peptidoglycan hydrolase CwlO-like protein